MNDQKLTNKGWTAMRATLDREMPVDRDRKPLAWLWWLLGLIPIVIVAVGMMWETPEPKHGPAVPTLPERPVAASPAGEMRATETASIVSNTPARIQGEQFAAANTPTGFSAAKEPQQRSSSRFGAARTSAPSTAAIAKNRPSAQSATENDAASALHHTTSGPQAPTTTVSGVFAAERTVENPPSNAHDATAAEPNNATPREAQPAPLATLPSRVAQAPTPALNAPELVYVPINADITQPARKPALQWSANASLWIDDHANASGGGGGLALDWRPIRRAGLRVGLNYIHQRPGEDRVVAVTNQSYYDATFDVNVITNSPTFTPTKSTASSVLVPVSKIHWLEAPVSVFWEPAQRWRIYGGFSLMRSLSATGANRTYAVSTSQILSVPDANQSALNQLIEMKLPNWQTAWTAGLSFRPIKHLELGLSYRFGVKNSVSAQETPENMLSGGNSASPGRNNDPKFNGFQSNSVSNSSAGISGKNLLQMSAHWLF